MDTPRLRVAIIGAGIGGLTAAVALCKTSDIEVHIYEASKELIEVGAGVGMWKRTWNVMQALGLSSDLIEMFGRTPVEEPTPVFRWRKSDDPNGGVEFYHLVVPFGQITFHRADFHRILIKHSSGAHLHLGKKLKHYSQASSTAETVELFFEDGSNSTCDVVVGADGIHSRTRESLLQEFVLSRASLSEAGKAKILSAGTPFWTGSIAYRGVIPIETLQKKWPSHRATLGPYMWCGKNRHIVSFLVSKGRFINVVAFCSRYEMERKIYPGPWVSEVNQDELLEQYSGWEPDVISLLNCLEKPSRWAVHAVDGLPSYTYGRVALLGDSAHAMTPHQGSGGGQSIEDAFILSSLLSNPLTTRETLPQALTVYDMIRRPISQSVLERSRETGFVYEFKTDDYDGRPIDTDGDLEALRRSADRLWPLWKWAWTGRPEEDQQLAEEMFKTVIDEETL